MKTITIIIRGDNPQAAVGSDKNVDKVLETLAREAYERNPTDPCGQSVDYKTYRKHVPWWTHTIPLIE